MKKRLIYDGLDVHKDSMVVAMAAKRQPAVVVRRLLNDWVQLVKTLDGIGGKDRLRVCYEAGPTGYDLARRLNAAGVCCVVVAPSLVAVRVQVVLCAVYPGVW